MDNMRTFTHTPIPTKTDPEDPNRFIKRLDGTLVDTQMHERVLAAQIAYEKKKRGKKKEEPSKKPRATEVRWVKI